jgi:hypothetical protein
MRRSSLVLGLLGISALAAAGCQSRISYDEHWKSGGVVLASANAATPLAGKWQGSWQSNDSDYYYGLAHAIIVPLDTVMTKEGVKAQRYEAHIQLYHFWLFTEEFRVYLTATPGLDGKTNFYGERILNPVDGVCRYDGFQDGDKIVTSYNSIKDYGSYVLRRLTPESPSVGDPTWAPTSNSH